MHIEVTDDSGFLAVIVPAAYEGFVDSEWQLEQLFTHFRAQMAQRTLLIWGTGLSGTWRVDVRFDPSTVKGHREASGPLRVTGGRVLITNYEGLTMAAQFEDIRLPQRHEHAQLVELPDGEYCCRVIQMFDPNEDNSAGPGKPDFILELSAASAIPPTWLAVPWFDAP